MKTQFIQLTFAADNSLVFVNVANITHFSADIGCTSLYLINHSINVKETPVEIQAKIS